MQPTFIEANIIHSQGAQRSKVLIILTLKATLTKIISRGVNSTAPKKDRPFQLPASINARIFVPTNPVMANKVVRIICFQKGIL